MGGERITAGGKKARPKSQGLPACWGVLKRMHKGRKGAGYLQWREAPKVFLPHKGRHGKQPRENIREGKFRDRAGTLLTSERERHLVVGIDLPKRYSRKQSGGKLALFHDPSTFLGMIKKKRAGTESAILGWGEEAQGRCSKGMSACRGGDVGSSVSSDGWKYSRTPPRGNSRRATIGGRGAGGDWRIRKGIDCHGKNS